MDAKNFLIISLLCLFTGLLFSGGAIILLLQSYPLRKNDTEIKGTVIGLSASQDNDDTYAPIVRFTTPDGRDFTFTGTTYSKPPAYKIGQTITVIYQANHPGEFRIKKENSLAVLVFAILGGLQLLIGLCAGGLAILSLLSGQ